ncbi:hypothetical protein DPMN_163033 [Dreissena polymorpha]|uniref:Uncharacterized protein n=1 Tax=Dreissena polymorpha TaxID=45954 RepID=A0A9D4ERD8_DREPO|nr:hypothetical protein DPMN_163033 [Dreissena polymorpha]
MVCSATSFLLLVMFCGTVSCIFSPTVKPNCYGVTCPSIYCTYGQYKPPGKCCPKCKQAPNSNKPLPCKIDADCAAVVCDNEGEEVECHDAVPPQKGRECHCHIPGECLTDSDCIEECGHKATCDDGACHGKKCDHT